LVCGRIDDAATAEFNPMATSISHSQLERFRREAKKLGRELSIPHSEALDRIAARHNFQNWSLLAKHSEADTAQPKAPLPAHTAPPSELLSQHYLHGDVQAVDPARCFCARCDWLVDASHFDGVGFHRESDDGERYLRALANWKKRSPAEKASYGYRPDDTPNVLAERAVRERRARAAERRAREARRSPFHRWLEQHQSRPSVQDLAEDILNDLSFPVELATRREIEAHLSQHGGHVIRGVRAAWREFEADLAER